MMSSASLESRLDGNTRGRPEPRPTTNEGLVLWSVPSEPADLPAAVVEMSEPVMRLRSSAARETEVEDMFGWLLPSAPVRQECGLSAHVRSGSQRPRSRWRTSSRPSSFA